MSYTRDKDAYTRGPGASVSHDRSRAHRARRARMVAASNARDTYLAGLTYGERGGLGVANDAGTVMGSGNVRRPTIGVPPRTEAPPTKPTWTGGGNITVFDPPAPKPALPPPFKLPAVTRVTATAGQLATQLDRGPGFAPVMVDPMRTGTGSGGGLLPPSRKPPYTGIVPTGGGGSAGVTTGGGASGSTTPPKGATDSPVVIPDPDDLPDAVATPKKKTPWLLFAAIAGGAWLLLRNQDGDE